MYVVRTETTAYGSASAVLAYTRLRELQRDGKEAAVFNGAGKPVDFDTLQIIAAVETGLPRLP